MVIFYDIETKEIKYTERDSMLPNLPGGTTEEKIDLLRKENIGFVSVAYELDLEVFNYKVAFDEKNNFIGLQPKEV
ncbi:MAG: hypothetical protein E6248_04870 [Clostridium sp.]|uniref:hypothetical protein n=1 Tax=Clostridium sp. TaxID=1506 RepID=UPI0029141E76|nr:hypothetical protein [Clostridium sp.]MDU5109753.1 hypothetical protein [Clostridium sp.]